EWGRAAGGFTAIVDLRDGSVRKLATRASLAYHNPGCGAGEDVAISALDSYAPTTTSVVLVNAATGAEKRSTHTKGQLTSVTPYGNGIVASLGNHLVSLDAKGGSTVV